jgi:uncharacterized RDD family membrane protein YckC
MAVNPYAAPSADLNAGVSTDAPLAGRGARLGAVFIDGLLFVVPYLLIVFGGKAESSILLLVGGLAVLGLAIFQIYKAVTTGQTIGKKLVGVKVVKLDGSPVDFVSMFVMRMLVGQGLLGIIPLYGLIDPLFIFREDHRCIHDLVASTKVIDAK